MDMSGWLRKQPEQASPDLLRVMVQEMAEALMGAEVDALCGAAYGERSSERVNRRNGYRERESSASCGTIDSATALLQPGRKPDTPAVGLLHSPASRRTRSRSTP